MYPIRVPATCDLVYAAGFDEEAACTVDSRHVLQVGDASADFKLQDH